MPRPLVGRKLVEEMEEYYKSLKPEAQERYSLKLQCAGLSLKEDPYLIKVYSKDTTRDRLGEGCSHVAVIMFKVEAGVRLGYTSCTSEQCSWNETHTDKVNLCHNCKNIIILHF